MYLVRVEPSTRQEIGASAAVHAELGREYDAAVAEGLVERIGAEIDKRVDAQIASARKIRSRRPGTAATVVMGLGSMALGLGATSIVLGNAAHGNTTGMVVVIWAAIAVINGMFINRK